MSTSERVSLMSEVVRFPCCVKPPANDPRGKNERNQIEAYLGSRVSKIEFQLEQTAEARNQACLFTKALSGKTGWGDNPQEFLNSDRLVSLDMRQTNQVEHIQVRQDDDGDYWIVITAEANSVGISLSSNHQLNPNRTKLEAWAEEQLRRGEQGKEPFSPVPES